MASTGNENHDINFEEAAELTQRFRNSISPEDCIGGFFGKSAVMSLLDQEDCVGVRYYYGIHADGSNTLVLVGVDTDGNDLIGDGRICLQQPTKCPPYCSEGNLLNSNS